MLQDPGSGNVRRKSMDPVSQHIHLEDLPTPGSRFELGELLGEGTYSKVYAGVDKQKGNKVAVKIISNIPENILEIESEYLVLSSIGGQSLIPEFHGTYLHTPKNAKRQLWFVMELCEGVPVSELLAWMTRESITMQEEEIAALLKAFMMALHHLHENDIIHRDVKSSNFILSPNGDVRLIDFGSCALVKDTEGKTHSSIGTPWWMAPEVISCEQQRPYTKCCDVWSLGITALELAEGQPPLFDIHPVRAMFQIARNPPPTFKKMIDWTEPFKDFISECLEKNPEHRPCVLELLLHPFISNVDDTNSSQDVTMEEHLEEQFVPQLGSRAKQILKRLGDMVSENLYPLTPSKPLAVTVKNWNFKSDAESPFKKQLPDDLAATENATEDYIVEHLIHRFSQDEIYSYIGDVLVAVNPRKKMPIYDSKIQVQYWEKARSDNPPHVFAVGDRAYQQMLHHKRSQIIIFLGKCNSGKSYSATQIVNQLAFLCPSSNIAMAEKMQQLCPLLDTFGSARTTYNQNASRFLKTVSITFTKTGKVTGAIINALLLDRTRISATPPDESNFHVFYYIYEGLKAEKRLAEFGLDKLSSMKYLSQIKQKNQADLVAGYRNMYQAFRILAYTEEEILVIIRILSAIMLLGDVTYTTKGSSVTPNNPYLVTTAAKYLSIDGELLNNIVGRGPSIEEVQSKRDAWVEFLYLHVFQWIITSINKQLSFTRLVLGECYSVTVIDGPGFGTTDANHLFRLGVNLINDFLQNYTQRFMFLKELEEYNEEGIEIPFQCDEAFQKHQNLTTLVQTERILLSELRNAEKLNSLPSQFVEVNGDEVYVHHIFDKVTYKIQDLTADNIDAINDPEFMETFKSTDDLLTSAIANAIDEIKSIPDEILNLSPKIIEEAQDTPHLVICLQPSSSSREDIRYEPECVLQQLRAFNIMETIMIRQQGYSRRISFEEFLNWYKYLAFDFDEEVELTKENCQLLLIRLKLTGYMMGENKVFLKYYTEEYLSRMYEDHVKNIVKVQAMIRRYIAKSRQARKA